MKSRFTTLIVYVIYFVCRSVLYTVLLVVQVMFLEANVRVNACLSCLDILVVTNNNNQYDKGYTLITFLLLLLSVQVVDLTINLGLRCKSMALQ